MKKINFLVVCSLLATCFLACNDDDETTNPKPVITSFTVESEVGGGNTIALGGMISFEFDAEMQTNDKIESYHLEIHDEPASGLAADEYILIDEEFEVGGLRNTHVHDHVEVPVDANTGKYHFHLTVTSAEGYTETKEMELQIIENKNAPSVSNFSVSKKSGSGDYQVGDIVVISFTAKAVEGNTLKNYHLEIHDEPASGKLEDEFKLVDEDFTTNFEGLTEAVISHEVEVKDGGAKGKYHVHLHVTDNKNNATAKADEITIK